MAFKFNTVIVRFLNADVDTQSKQLKWTNQKYMLGYHDYAYYVNPKLRIHLKMKQIVLISNQYGQNQPAVIIDNLNLNDAKTKHVPLKNYTKYLLQDYLKQYHQGTVVLQYANQEYNYKVGNYHHQQKKLNHTNSKKQASES